MNQTTSWTHPVSCMEHQTNSSNAPPPQPQSKLAVQDLHKNTQQQSHPSQPAPSLSSQYLPPPPPAPAASSSEQRFLSPNTQTQNNSAGNSIDRLPQQSSSNHQERRPPSPQALTRNSPRKKEGKGKEKTGNKELSSIIAS